jgi:hypothetical protein
MTSNQPWWLTMPVAEVAAAILPLFSYPPCSPCLSELAATEYIVSWCRTGSWGQRANQPAFKTERAFVDPDFRAVAEAIHVLDRAGLLMCTDTSRAYEAWIRIGLTRLGMHALQINTVRQHLGLSEAPPTT